MTLSMKFTAILSLSGSPLHFGHGHWSSYAPLKRDSRRGPMYKETQGLTTPSPLKQSLLCVGFYEASDRNEYKACIGPNGKATQFSSGQNRDFNIGTFSDIFLDNSRGGSFTIKWTGGARNFCSKNRSAEATGICAPSNVSRFKSVTEPSGCTYYFEIEEPYFCASSVDEFWEKVRG